MDGPENPWEDPQVEVNQEMARGEVPESLLASESDSREIMELIFPEDRVISVRVYAYASRTGEKLEIKVITDRSTPEYTAAGLIEYEFRSSWTVPTARQMDTYREECSEYNRQSQATVLNNLAIRDLIVAFHLKELLIPPSYWSFPLKFTRPDRLSGETVKHLKSMHSGMYDLLYTEFISESCLTA